MRRFGELLSSRLSCVKREEKKKFHFFFLSLLAKRETRKLSFASSFSFFLRKSEDARRRVLARLKHATDRIRVLARR